MLRLLILWLMSLVLHPALGQAISETGFQANYDSQVAPFFASGHTGELQGARAVPIRFISFIRPGARGAVVIANGLGESYGKYAELAYDLNQSGYSVFMFDHRGQGHSGRILSETRMAYIDRFKFFVEDMKAVVETVAKPQAPGLPLHLLSHSMGGAIAARYLEKYPDDFQAAALSAPMIKIDLRGRSPRAAKFVLAIMQIIGRGQKYAYGTSAQDPSSLPFEANAIIRSHERYEGMQNLLRHDPSVVMDGVSNSWLLRAMIGGERALSQANRIKTPMLVLQAGQETLVENSGEESFCKVAQACTLARLPDARHEILMDIDSVRNEALQKIIGFFDGHGR